MMYINLKTESFPVLAAVLGGVERDLGASQTHRAALNQQGLIVNILAHRFLLTFEVGPKAMGWSLRTSTPASMSLVATRHRPRSSGHVCTRYEGSDGVVVAILNSEKFKQFTRTLSCNYD